MKEQVHFVFVFGNGSRQEVQCRTPDFLINYLKEYRFEECKNIRSITVNKKYKFSGYDIYMFQYFLFTSTIKETESFLQNISLITIEQND